jgi:hypothetical protein
MSYFQLDCAASAFRSKVGPYPAACLKGVSTGLWKENCGLLTVVAKALCRRADFCVVSNITAFVTGTSRERRHGYVMLLKVNG